MLTLKRKQTTYPIKTWQFFLNYNFSKEDL